jgi:hypothetical protein
MPPPAFDYNEMLFSVSIRDGSGKEIVSEVLCGDQLDSLKNDGHAIAIFEQPIIIGTYPAGSVDAYERYAERDAECDNWSVTVHLFRLDKNKCCCVHEPGSCDWDSSPDRDMDAAIATVGWANYSSSQHLATLELDEGGKLLLEGRLQEQLDRHFVGDGDVPHFQGIQFDVELNCRVQHQAPPRPADPSVATVVLEFRELRLMAKWVYTDEGREDFIDADIDPEFTLPHLLEHLKGWGDPDD